MSTAFSLLMEFASCGWRLGFQEKHIYLHFSQSRKPSGLGEFGTWESSTACRMDWQELPLFPEQELNLQLPSWAPQGLSPLQFLVALGLLCVKTQKGTRSVLVLYNQEHFGSRFLLAGNEAVAWAY